MKSILLVLSLAAASVCNAEIASPVKTGTVSCTLRTKDGGKRGSADIVVDEKGVGGFSDVSVTNGSVTCSTKGFAKFLGTKNEILGMDHFSITTTSGDKVASHLEWGPKKNGLSSTQSSALEINDKEAICLCRVVAL